MKAKILRTDAQHFIIEQYLEELAAVADVETTESTDEDALALAPTHADGLLERGILRRLRQDNDGARQDWLRVLRRAPKSRAAAAARRNLEKMDVKPD